MRIISATLAALTLCWAGAACGQEAAGSTEAYVVCHNLTLYAQARDANGVWRGVRLEDARTPPTTTYNAQSAEPATVEGAPALLLRDGRVQLRDALVTFDQIVIGACPEAAARTQAAGPSPVASAGEPH
ncbi:MAG: hypothetical protein ABUL73_05255 [Alphaproteobacteria bacterium]